MDSLWQISYTGALSPWQQSQQKPIRWFRKASLSFFFPFYVKYNSHECTLWLEGWKVVGSNSARGKRQLTNFWDHGLWKQRCASETGDAKLDAHISTFMQFMCRCVWTPAHPRNHMFSVKMCCIILHWDTFATETKNTGEKLLSREFWQHFVLYNKVLGHS